MSGPTLDPQIIAALEAEAAPEAPEPEWPAALRKDALVGLPGVIVGTIEPHSESDPAALLIQLLVAIGSAIGRGPGYEVEATHHGTNLFALIVGNTSQARKGTSWNHIRRIVSLADPSWEERIKSGTSSGEGLVQEVRDPRSERRKAKKGEADEADDDGYIEEEVDLGVEDKRLLVLETEFASVLRIMRREGSIVSTLLRQAWERGDLGTLTKNAPTRATGAHVSVVGHISSEELRRELTATDAASGFGNRFLLVCAARSKLLPHGGNLAEADVEELAGDLRRSLGFAQTVERVEQAPRARALWESAYERLTSQPPGMFGVVTARAAPQVLRLATIYALVDESDVIQEHHLKAGLAVWDYCEASARWIFGDALGDPMADTIGERLRAAGEAGLTRTEIRDVFAKHKSVGDIDRALNLLARIGRAKRFTEPTGGRPTERWVDLSSLLSLPSHPATGNGASA